MSWSKSYFLRHTCSILCALEHESGMRSTYIVFERCLLLASQLVMGNNTMCVVKHHMYCTRECRRLRQKLLLWRDPSMADILIPSHRNLVALFSITSWLQEVATHYIVGFRLIAYIYIYVYIIRMSKIHTINPKVGQFNQLSYRQGDQAFGQAELNFSQLAESKKIWSLGSGWVHVIRKNK